MIKNSEAIPCRLDALVKCPFCLEDDFDLIGLKNHLLKGHCDVFNETEAVKVIKMPSKKRKQWKCRTCGFVFTGGDPGGVFAEFGQIWCDSCVTLATVNPKTNRGAMYECT